MPDNTTQQPPSSPSVESSAAAEWEYDDDDDSCCGLCGGAGVIVTCIDDLCVGAGECMHGDGEEICPNPRCVGSF